MHIAVASGSSEWTDFEKEAWAEADNDHYGQAVDWDKKEFHITANEGDVIVGSLRFDIRAGVAYIDAIIVAPAFRGKGIGKQLLLTAEKVAQENKAHKIYLQTGKDWGLANLYQKLGYEITSELPNHHANTDFIEMTKFI